jgi:hypothetical protein
VPREQKPESAGDDWAEHVSQVANEVKPPFPASLMKEARRQVDLEEAVRWERDRRGLPKDGIDDWKRRSIIYVYLAMIVIGVFLYVGLVLN